jgi:phosphonate degradation associated HDIG domain protein
MTVYQEISEIFEKRGAGSYYGEPVSQLEHGLQAAHFAKKEGASEHLIVAALLHDIGHLIDDSPEDIADKEVDTRHEEIGLNWLRARFGAEIAEPVHLHVAAKRYLCATDSAYLQTLSPASVLSLSLQGGPMTAAEVAAFERNPFFREAVRLRRWDDESKVEHLETPPLESYQPLIESLSHQRQ